MEKFQNKFRIPSARFQNWDYGNEAAYFITICTNDREHYFGEIENNEMIFNVIGKLAEQYWFEIPNHFPGIGLDNFVVMPNHVHGILIIERKKDFGEKDNIEEGMNVGNAEGMTNCMAETLQCNVSTDDNAPDTFKNEEMAKISPKRGTVSAIVRSYKSAVSKNAHFTNSAFRWQTRFYDHIIRNGDEYHRIADYISNNPQRWKEDKFYASGLG